MIELNTQLNNVTYQNFYHKHAEGYVFFENDTLKGVLLLDPAAHDSIISKDDIDALLKFMGAQPHDTPFYKPNDAEIEIYLQHIIQD